MTVRKCSPDELAGLSRQVLGSGNTLRFRAGGHSMSPLIQDGDVLLVFPVDPQSPPAGSVLLSEYDSGSLKAHRLIRDISSGPNCTLITKGDSSLEPDEPLRLSQVLGIVRALERDGKRIELDRDNLRRWSSLYARLEWMHWRIKAVSPQTESRRRIWGIIRYIFFIGLAKTVGLGVRITKQGMTRLV